MNIRIQTLTLTNFKCFRSKTFHFDGRDIITVRGRNGAGKTTIADAVLWCLFGKNTAGQADFDLKTHDSSGRPIPNLDHSVEMELCVRNLINDGKDENAYSVKTITLKRTLKETWMKKRGSDEQVFKNNTTEYIVNGEITTAADYKKYISSLISEDTFRAITSPTYFPSLKWQQQREFLTQMAGDITPDTSNVQFAALSKLLADSNEDIVAYRKHLAYQIKQVKDKLDRIPIRLEEQNKALPELLDWQQLQARIEETKNDLTSIDNKIGELSRGNGADVKRSELRDQISKTTVAIDQIAFEARAEAEKLQEEHRSTISKLNIWFSETLGNQKLMEQTIEADRRMIERAQETDYEAELQKLRDQWPSSRFVFDRSLTFCPTCGREFPAEKIDEIYNDARQKFNLQREAKVKSLNEAAARVKEQQAQAADALNLLKQKLADDEKALARIKESINTIFSEKAKTEKTHVTTTDEILAANVQYTALSKQLADQKTALNSVADSEDNMPLLNELKQQRQTAELTILRLSNELATKQQYERIMSLIEGINQEQRDLVTQLSELERREDTARQYQDCQNHILEEHVNQHFSLVKWRMFRTVNNGGEPFDEPYCECYVDGVAYHDGLNQAARLNAGLDICNVLCKHYNVSAPIIIDNSESSLNILETVGQQLRLEVFNSDLQIV